MSESAFMESTGKTTDVSHFGQLMRMLSIFLSSIFLLLSVICANILTHYTKKNKQKAEKSATKDTFGGIGTDMKKMKHSGEYDGQIRITTRIKCSMLKRKLIKKLADFLGKPIEYFLE